MAENKNLEIKLYRYKARRNVAHCFMRQLKQLSEALKMIPMKLTGGSKWLRRLFFAALFFLFILRSSLQLHPEIYKLFQKGW